MSALEKGDIAGAEAHEQQQKELTKTGALDADLAVVVAEGNNKAAAEAQAEKLDELTSLEREIAEMHHVEPASPALAQRVVDLVHNGGGGDATVGSGESDAVLLEILPPSRGVTPAGAVHAESTLPGNGELSGDVSNAVGDLEANALKHEDLIAVLKGIDQHAESKSDVELELKHCADERNAPACSDSELVDGVTIEGEGQFQIMEIVDDETDEAASEKEDLPPSVVGNVSNVTASTGLKSFAEATTKLTNDEIRAMAMEQMAGLDARSERQRRRKQDIKPLQVEENTDLVSSLGADWSDDDTGADDSVPAGGEKSAVAAPKAVPPTTALSATLKSENNVAEGGAAKPTETEIKPLPKVSNVVVLKSSKPASTEPTSEVASKSAEVPAQLPQPTGFRRTRIIKRKIIWDPDAPETQFSYAQLVRNPAKNSENISAKTSTNVQASTITKSTAAATAAVSTTKSTAVSAVAAAAAVKKEPPAKRMRPNTPKAHVTQPKERKLTPPVTQARTNSPQVPIVEKKVTARAATPSKATAGSVAKAAVVTSVNATTTATITATTGQSTKLVAADVSTMRGPSPAKRRSQTPVANGAGGKKKKGELDRLMGDEGAITMLNSLESERSRLSVEQDDDKPHKPLMRSRAATISERVLKRDTTPTTVKSAGTTVATTATAVNSTPTTKARRAAKAKPSSTWDYVYKQQASEEAMIIRRRSNSSYSSNASQHRLSLDAPVTPKTTGSNKSAGANASASSTPATTPASAATNSASKSASKGTPKTPSSTQDAVESPSPTGSGKAGKGSFEFAKPESKSNQKTNRRTKSPGQAANPLASDMKKQTLPATGSKRTTRSPAVVEEKEKEKTSGGNKTQTVGVKESKEDTTTSPATLSDVMVKKAAKVAQIIFNTQRAKLNYTFTAQMMNKLVDVLDKLSKDGDCNAVVMTTNAPHFCHGIDFTDLTVGSAEKRKQAAIQLATAVKNYLKTLATFPKPLIAGVNGSNIGLGVTQLPLFDIIIASDKGSYETPYAKIGQVPEGYCIWNNITKIRGTFKTKLFWLCEKLHSTESALSGLVNKLTPPSKVNEDALLTAKKIAAMSPESYRVMKKTTIHNHLDIIVTALDEEFDTIITQWTSNECLENFKKYAEAGHF